MPDLTPRQAEILAWIDAGPEHRTVHVRPGGNTDAAVLHADLAALVDTEGISYSRVLHPLRDAGLITVGDKSPQGRPVEATEHGRLVATSFGHSLAAIEARIQLTPARGHLEHLFKLADDARRMARVLRAIENEVERAERDGKDSVQIFHVRYELRKVVYQ